MQTSRSEWTRENVPYQVLLCSRSMTDDMSMEHPTWCVACIQRALEASYKPHALSDRSSCRTEFGRCIIMKKPSLTQRTASSALRMSHNISCSLSDDHQPCGWSFCHNKQAPGEIFCSTLARTAVSRVSSSDPPHLPIAIVRPQDRRGVLCRPCCLSPLRGNCMTASPL
jgi:hypothetical protein